jgi:hypothetical protein
MSLTGYTDLSTTYKSIGKTISDLLAKSNVTVSQGSVLTNSLIAYNATTKSQVDDWISFLKTSATTGNVTKTGYSLLHLISWQSN